MHPANRKVSPMWVVAAAVLATAPSSAATPDPFPLPTGTQLALEAADLPTDALRGRLLVDELLAGHHPSTTFQWKTVTWTAADAAGALHQVTLRVSPDYLAVGTDEDSLYAALALPQAAVVARALDFCLPTPLVVDRIYDAAGHHYPPRPLPPTVDMRTPEWWLRHRAEILGFDAAEPDELSAGQKKDVVLSARLQGAPRRLAIYGWHNASGDPIQPLSLFHGIAYADYSHGLRAIAPTMQVDGHDWRYVDVLSDPVLCALLSDEGPIDAPAVLASAIRVGAALGVVDAR